MLDAIKNFSKDVLKPTETVEKKLISIVNTQTDVLGPANQTVLILSKYLNGYHDWIQKRSKKVLFTSTETFEKMKATDRSHYSEIQVMPSFYLIKAF